MAEEVIVNGIIKVRRDTTENWSSTSYVLQEGELGYDKELHKLVVGDGESDFASLTAIGADGEVTQMKGDVETLQGDVSTLQEKVNDTYSKSETDAKVEELIEAKLAEQAKGPFHYKGTKDSLDTLTTEEEEPELGDVWQVGEESKELYVWDGDSWETFGKGSEIDLSGKVDAKVKGSLGTAGIINEGDGGCLIMELDDGKTARVSVHDGSGNGVLAQMQGGVITRENNRNTGTTISLFEEKATYRSKANAAKEIQDSDLEIATVGDLKDFVRQTMNSDVGQALILNDETGGGLWFRNTSGNKPGVESFIGVNNGEKAENGKDTPMAQMYAADSETKKDGSFINVYQDYITYNSRSRMKAGAKNGDKASEIATVSDVAKVGPRYEVGSLLDGARTNIQGNEIRVMFKTDTAWKKQDGPSDNDQYNADCYYFSVKFFAPTNDVDGYKEDNGETIHDTKLYSFTPQDFGGVDELGRKYSIVWFPAAKWTADEMEGPGTWEYYGADSTAEHFRGWYHTIEWYKGGTVVASETIRINLANEDCYNSVKPFYATNPFYGMSVILDGGNAKNEG